jgi:hypothetical protein
MVDDFIEFLQQNPDLKEELSLFENVSIEQEEITFNKKELLLKEKYDSEKEFNNTSIAELEGDISSSEKAEFEKYLLTHPEKQKEANLFKLTKIHPDQSVTFSKKHKLYHRTAGKTIFLWSLRVAAVIIVALSVYTFIDNSSDQIITENKFAAVTEKEPEKNENKPLAIEAPEQKEKKVVQPVIQKDAEKPVLKKEKPKTEPTKSLRENSKGRLENEDLAIIRPTEEIPARINRLNAIVYAGIPETKLAPVDMPLPVTNENIYEEKYFVDIVKEKTGFEKLSISKITKAGLNLVSNISKEKFQYDTDTEGKITDLKYDSRILAFSIPTKKETDRK